MSSGVAVIIGLLPLLLLLARVAVALGYALGRGIVWLLEEPEGMKGAAARLVVVAALLHGAGLL